MFVTPAFADLPSAQLSSAHLSSAHFALAQTNPFGGDSPLTSIFVPMALVFVIFYFLMLRPQQKKVKEHQELIKNLRRGDTVITTGGLVGKVTKVVDDEQIEVEIADGVRVRQVRSMVSGVRAKGEPVKDDGG
jgi:preprotein translocase subunit YajC